MDQRPKHRPNTIKLLEEKIKNMTVFLDLRQKKPHSIKVKIDKVDYIKI